MLPFIKDAFGSHHHRVFMIMMCTYLYTFLTRHVVSHDFLEPESSTSNIPRHFVHYSQPTSHFRHLDSRELRGPEGPVEQPPAYGAVSLRGADASRPRPPGEEMIDHGKELTKITLMYRRRLTGISRHIAFEWYRCFHLLVMSRPMVQVAELLLQDRSMSRSLSGVCQ